ncbi:MAG: D-alanine--D-alanine ligase [Oscillospiraceae bacterium]|jgi:D-alanine-D-alanine ligase|nr:D-alanine--D-alanine ligase [Oscillospiraceae bacterium]
MKIKLALLFGGKSVEHEISVISALQAAAALDSEKYDVLPVYLTKQNAFYTGPAVGDIKAYCDIPALLKASRQVIPANIGGKATLLYYPPKGRRTIMTEIDCVLPIVHGTNAEDGTLQGFLRLLGAPFVGCDVAASAIGMDKYAQKCVFRQNGIPVLDCALLRASSYDADPDSCEAKLAELGFPLIVKPANLGSSVGITKASSPEALRRALDLAFRFAARVLVEPAVQHLREINCAVLGDGNSARASVCEEPLNADEILSYENKYLNGGKNKSGAKLPSSQPSKGMASLERKIPADIPPALAARVQDLAVRAFQCLDCSGVARVDFLLNGETGALYLNEINTIPGSLSFYLWEPTGLPYPRLLDEMIQLAYRRQRMNEDLQFSFDTNVLANADFGGVKS